MSRQPHWHHQHTCSNLYTELRAWSLTSGMGQASMTPGVIFSDAEIHVVPDVVWISNERLAALMDEAGHHGAPELAIEVLSPGVENERRDREAKLKLYESRGVREYWIVDWRIQQLEVYRRDQAMLRPGRDVVCRGRPDLTLAAWVCLSCSTAAYLRRVSGIPETLCSAKSSLLPGFLMRSDVDVMPVRADEQFDYQAMQIYLHTHVAHAEGPLEVRQFSSLGTPIFFYLLRMGEQEWVMRRPPLGPTLPTAHDMRRELPGTLRFGQLRMSPCRAQSCSVEGPCRSLVCRFM